MSVYVLSQHPEIFARLREHVMTHIGVRRPTYDDIKEMKYLRAFLNGTSSPFFGMFWMLIMNDYVEVLRLYPVVVSAHLFLNIVIK